MSCQSNWNEKLMLSTDPKLLEKTPLFFDFYNCRNVHSDFLRETVKELDEVIKEKICFSVFFSCKEFQLDLL